MHAVIAARIGGRHANARRSLVGILVALVERQLHLVLSKFVELGIFPAALAVNGGVHGASHARLGGHALGAKLHVRPDRHETVVVIGLATSTALTERATDPLKQRPGLRPFMRDLGDQVLSVEIFAVVLCQLHEITATQTDGCRVPGEQLTSTGNFFGAQARIALSLLLIAEILAVNHHIAEAVLGNDIGYLQFNRCLAIVEILQDHLVRQGLLFADESLDGIRGCASIEFIGGPIAHFDRVLCMHHAVIANDQLLGATAMIEPVIHAFLFHPAGKEVKMGFLILANETARTIIARQFQFEC